MTDLLLDARDEVTTVPALACGGDPSDCCRLLRGVILLRGVMLFLGVMLLRGLNAEPLVPSESELPLLPIEVHSLITHSNSVLLSNNIYSLHQ